MPFLRLGVQVREADRRVGHAAGSSLAGTGAGCMWVSIARSRSTTMETVTGECQSENRRE